MKNMNLSKIFEAITNDNGNPTVDLSTYPALKKIIDMYTPVKIAGNYIIRPDDFNSLLLRNDKATEQILTLMSRGVDTTVDTSTPQGRIFKFYSDLKLRANKPEYRAAYDELSDLIAECVKFIRDPNSPQPAPAPIPPKVKPNPVVNGGPRMSINDTLYLKNFDSVEVDGDVYKIDDDSLKIFNSNNLDPIVERYKTAINNDDLSLPDDVSTEAGLVYTLFKKLKTDCTGLLSSLTRVRQSLGGQNNKLDGSSKTSSEYYKIDMLVFATLHRDSKIKLSFKLYNLSGQYYNNSNAVYSSLFEYTKLKKNYQFVNEHDKNNFFIFALKRIPNSLEVGKTYEVIYDTSDINSADLKMEVIAIESSEEKKSDISTFSACGAMDEFIELYKLHKK